MKISLYVCILALLAIVTSPARSQSLADRIRQLKRHRIQRVKPAPNSPAQRLAKPIDPIQLQNVTAKEALTWWGQTTGIAMLVNWNALEQQGIDPETRVNLTLKHVPANVVLKQLLSQISNEVPLFVETTPWFIQILTQDQINRKTVLQIYDVRDLLMVVPQFKKAPRFDLAQVLRSGSSTGSSSSNAGTGASSLFSSPNQEQETDNLQSTPAERGEQLAQLVRDTIEPAIWIANGGQYASIRYFDGKLIVRAPRYVQRQIGNPTSYRPKHHYTIKGKTKHAAHAANKTTHEPTSKARHSDVASIAPKSTRKKVSGIDRAD